MVTALKPAWGRIALQGLVAGIIGAILLDLFLWLVLLLPAHTGIATLWQTIGTQALGKGMAGDPNATWYGLVVYLVVSIVWAGAYAYVAAGRAFFNQRWALAGPFFGLIVYIFMQIVLLVSNNFEYPHTPNDFVLAVIAHIFAFGLPVAYVVKSLDRA